MKKRIMLVSIALMVLLFGTVVAESMYFTKPVAEATLDELLEMKAQIDGEILTRFEKLDGIMIEPGMYIVGEDIPEGNYYFEGVKGRYSTSVSVYPSINKTGTLDAIQWISGIGYGDFASSPKTGKVILQNGNAVEIVQGPAIIHPYMGLMN